MVMKHYKTGRNMSTLAYVIHSPKRASQSLEKSKNRCIIVRIPYHSKCPAIIPSDFGLGFPEENDLEDEYYECDNRVQDMKAQLNLGDKVRGKLELIGQTHFPGAKDRAKR